MRQGCRYVVLAHYDGMRLRVQVRPWYPAVSMASSAPASAAAPRRPVLLLGGVVALGLAALVLLVTADTDQALQRRLFGHWRNSAVFAALGLVWMAGLLMAWAVRRSWRNGVILVTVQLGVVWLLLELVGALGLVNYRRALGLAGGEALGSHALPSVDLSGETKQDLAALWNLPSAPIPFRYRTNSLGYRADVVDRTEAQTYLLGDSLLVGGLVPYAETIGGRLEALRGESTMIIALINSGVEREEHMLAQAKVPLAGRTLVQFVFEGNDLADSRRQRTNLDNKPIEPPWWPQRTLYFNLLYRLQVMTDPIDPRARQHMGYLGDDEYAFLWLDNAFVGFEDDIPSVLATLGRVRQRVESQGGRYRVVHIPTKLRVLGPLMRWPDDTKIAPYERHLGPLPAAMAAWARTEGVPYLDLTEALHAEAKAGRVPWYPYDTHWNPHGHDTAARAVAAWLAESTASATDQAAGTATLTPGPATTSPGAPSAP